MSLSLGLFGTFALRVNAEPAPSTRSRTEQWLLAYLVLHHHRDSERDALATLFFPDSPEQWRRQNLRRSLSHLRSILGPEAYRLIAPTPRTIRLVTSDAEIDVLRFDSLARRGDTESLQMAVELYTGELLESCTEDWILPEREARKQTYLQMLESLAAVALSESRQSASARFLRTLLSHDPARESAVCKLMEILAEQGDSAAVTQVWHDFRQVLHRLWNTEPTEATTALYRRLRQRDPLAVSMPVTTPSTPSVLVTTIPRRLPIPLTALLGRTNEVETVQGLLQSSRLVTLTGTGGTGKTRMAIHVAEQTIARFPDGLFFVGLAVVSDEQQVARIVLNTLGLKEEVTPSIVDILCDYLRERRVLLILDNCEHLIEAVAHLVHQLLTTCPELRILVTSREPLRVAGEQTFRIPSLTVPETASLSDETSVTTLLDYSAVRLFVERARAVNDRFRLTALNATAVITICRKLDGLPLALELAAARVSSLTAQQIATRLQDRFSLLTGGSRTAIPHHRTLQAALDWSYDLLSPSEQTLLNRLSIFVGDFSGEAAQVVTGSLPHFWEQLNDLVAKSLVVPEDHNGEVRYRLLETIGEFATGKLKVSPTEVDENQQRHYAYYSRLAGDANKNIWGAELASYLSSLDRERDNVRSAILHANGIDGLKLCLTLGNYWNHRDSYRDAIFLLQYALDKCTAEGIRPPPDDAAMARSWLGRFKRKLGEDQDAEQAYRDAVALSRESGNHSVQIGMQISLGAMYHEQGRMVESRAVYTEALTLSQAIGDKGCIAILQREMGILSHIEGDYVVARKQFESALRQFRASGAKWDEMVGLWWNGFACESMEDYEAAIALFEECRLLAAALGSPAMELATRQSLADVARDCRQFASAREQYESTLPLAEAVGDWYKQSVAWRGMSEASRGLGEVAAAREYCSRAISLAIHSDSPLLFALELLSEAAAVATLGKQHAVATQLYAFVESSRIHQNVPLPATVRRRHTEDRAILIQQLGMTEFSRLWQIGEKLTKEEALLICLG